MIKLDKDTTVYDKYEDIYESHTLNDIIKKYRSKNISVFKRMYYRIKPSIHMDFNILCVLFGMICVLISGIIFYMDEHVVNVDDGVCVEKHVGDDSLSFRFKRNRDGKDLQYTLEETSDNKNTFNMLNGRIKKGSICTIETNKFDEIKHVNVSVDD